MEMAFQPDIIVTDRDGSDIALVVEAKTAFRDLGRAEDELKE